MSSRALIMLTDLLRSPRTRLGTRWRKLTAGRQAVLTLAHLRKNETYADLAAGFEIGTTTVYRYLCEALDLLAALAPSLAQAIEVARGKAHVILLRIDRVGMSGGRDRRFYSGNIRATVIRMLRVTRTSAVKARAQVFNTLWGVMIGAPSPLRDELVELSKRTLVNRCLQLQPETENLLELAGDPHRLLTAGAATSLRDLARRWKALDHEIKSLNRQISELVRVAAPALLELKGVGIEVAAQFLVTCGDNTARIRGEAAFAKLCGVAPQPASSGRTTGRHRLSRDGDRAANSALYIVTIVRMRHHQPTRDYVERRSAEGLSQREIIRCLKRYIAREIYAHLPRPAASNAPSQHSSAA